MNVKTSESFGEVNTYTNLPLKNTLKKINAHDNIINITDIHKPSRANKNTNLLPITYENFIKEQLILTKYTIPILKDAAKTYKIHSSGKKQEIIDRLTKIFLQTKEAIQIQAAFRGWIYRYMIKLRGNALQNRSLCVNTTDFCTMEPLTEINKDYFYSVTINNHIYGFDVTSLIEMFKRNNKINPYTREPWSMTHINNIITLYNLSFILCDGFSKLNIPYKTCKTGLVNNHNRPQSSIRIDYNPITRPINREEDLIRYNNIVNIRSSSINNRINELFIEIDLLGNYTNREWFDNLDVRDYIRLYRKLYEIWYYTGELSVEVQNNICPFYSPFDGIFTRPLLHNEIQLQQIKTACLIAMENMVYSGISEDYRKIGTLHALSALTYVSLGARANLPWLYESIRN